ncbi:MAG: c-type cytochrome [Deltaproteobacteria bacterium]|nr:MAG: c-type cytochrome [Deltaproteobacteria bacterium]
MATTKAPRKMRVLLAVLSVSIVILSLYIIRGNIKPSWKDYQHRFHQMLRENYQAATSPEDKAKWGRLLEIYGGSSGIKQIYLPHVGVADLCITCHLGIDNPLLSDEDIPMVFRAHSGKHLKYHPVNRFGCTLCHQGQGVGTTVDGAHGYERNWPEPLLPASYVQASCLKCHSCTENLEGAEVVSQGEKIYFEKLCYGCHEVAQYRNLPQPVFPLTPLKTKLAEPLRWLPAWLKEPAKLRPDTLMPNYQLNDEEIKKMSAYLLSLPQEFKVRQVSLKYASYRQGRKLFIERGCRGCHGVDKEEKSALPRVPHLAGIGTKIVSDWLYQWISNPKSYSANTPMPQVELTRGEVLNIVSYLTTLKEEKELFKPPEGYTEGVKLEEGKRLTLQYGCYGCHEIKGFDDLPDPGYPISDFASKPLHDLHFGDRKDIPSTKWDWLYNKLKEPRIYKTKDIALVMPTNTMKDEELKALSSYGLGYTEPDESFLLRDEPLPESLALLKGRLLVQRFGCKGCHKMENDKEEPKIEKYIKQRTMRPPTQVGEGERVQPQWLYGYLLGPVKLRTWMEMTMPTFNMKPEEAEDIVSYLTVLSRAPLPYVSVPSAASVKEQELEMGAYRFRIDKCVQCHPASLAGELPEGIKIEDLSINLALSKLRLRPKWIRDFLKDPKKFAGVETRMPYIYYTPEGVPKIADPVMWIDLVTKYNMVSGEAPPQKVETLEEIRPGTEVDWTQYE